MGFKLVGIYSCDICNLAYEREADKSGKYVKQAAPTAMFTPPAWGHMTLDASIFPGYKPAVAKGTTTPPTPVRQCLVCPTCRQAFEEVASKLVAGIKPGSEPINRRKFNLEQVNGSTVTDL